MEARIQLELKGKNPSEVVDLLLDNCKATKISGLTEEFTSLTTMSLINCGLTTLEGLPKLESLRTIDLSDNKLTGELDKLVECCPRLYHVNLCANKIKDIETLAPLKKLEELAALDLFDCAVTEAPDYRQKLFELIPQLKYLDGFDVNDVEADLSDEEDAEDALDDEEVTDMDEEIESGDEENGLAYLDSSKAVQDEDESEDFVENGSAKKGKNGDSSDVPPRGMKRQREEAAGEGDDSNSEPAAKTSA
ncbi:leucine-rich repeat domain-containing protein [Ditylenchus destructor]|uniref:Leucine-rich repeat domain-containing protein n=1 Tax=Ditylenchus destructor TaxID=166010 RepID=A0AAD4MPI8_9BILA|nr:leucine-rich repeat domain-containing protein [Ditylenchus destructor]